MNVFIEPSAVRTSISSSIMNVSLSGDRRYCPPMRHVLSVAIIGLVVSTSFMACGDHGEESKSALDKAACSVAPPGTASPVGLPVGFPEVPEATYTGSTTAGPTTITTGIVTKKLADT